MLTPDSFSKRLLSWSEKNIRNYPWIGEKDPYKIWLSEIILQQTRSDQGKAYYLQFIRSYPNIFALATATEDQVLNLWKGLGYYSRARNLHTTAKYIVENFNGKFPEDFKELQSLKGIGEYTAAAISSFAFNRPHAVVDGNVIRVLSRIFGITTNIKTAGGKTIFKSYAQKYLNKIHPAAYNQAIMNFGAIHCTPAMPDCKGCIFNTHCFAFKNGKINSLPYKQNRISLRKRYLHYFIIKNSAGAIALHKRKEKDIWQHLFEPPLIETKKNITTASLKNIILQSDLFDSDITIDLLLIKTERQKLSHQDLLIKIYILKANKNKIKIKPDFSFVKPENLAKFAFPKILDRYFEEIK